MEEMTKTWKCTCQMAYDGWPLEGLPVEVPCTEKEFRTLELIKKLMDAALSENDEELEAMEEMMEGDEVDEDFDEMDLFMTRAQQGATKVKEEQVQKILKERDVDPKLFTCSVSLPELDFMKDMAGEMPGLS